MDSANSAIAYATKGNILYPGAAAEATASQVAAAARMNEILRSSTGPGGTPTAPSVDSGDLIVTASGEAAGSLNINPAQ